MTGTGLRLGAYAGVLAAAFAAALAVGAAADPITNDQEPAGRGSAQHQEAEMSKHDTGRQPQGHSEQTEQGGHGGHESGATTPAGLAVSEAGYTLRPVATTLPAGARVPFRFAVTGPDGAPLREYRPTHEKDLHLIVVRRDLARFQHVHPVRAGDGTWSVPLDLGAPGTYRVFADFAPAALDRTLTLGTDVAVGGDFRPAALPAPAAATSVDGYDVTLDGAPVAGRETELTFTVTRGGAKVTDLQPYLGAFGHLVSLRSGDLAYLHTHPAEDAEPGERGGPQVRFATTFPTAGTYRLFLDFQHDGRVRTAAFTVTVTGTGGHS